MPANVQAAPGAKLLLAPTQEACPAFITQDNEASVCESVFESAHAHICRRLIQSFFAPISYLMLQVQKLTSPNSTVFINQNQ